MLIVYILVGLLVLLLLFLFYVSQKPSTFRYERTTTIEASPEKVFPHLNNFHQWMAWSPWEKMDPTMKREYSGPEQGVGAAYSWVGNNKVGTGRMEIKQEQPPSKLIIQLDFLKPFEASNTADFTLEPAGSGTKLIWAMYGAQPFMAKLMSTFMDMDKLIGKDFEKGLANLKTAVEGK
jgi:carbon monoxide dehydrogenase subunit G